MTINNNIKPAWEAALAEQDSKRLEKLSASEVEQELASLGTSGRISPGLWATIRKFRETPASEIAAAMEREEMREQAWIETAPIAEIRDELDRLGVDRRKGADAVLAMVAAWRTRTANAEFASPEAASARGKPPSRRWWTYRHLAMAASVGSVLTFGGMMFQVCDEAPPKDMRADAVGPSPAAPGGGKPPAQGEKSFFRLKNSPAGAPRADEGARLTAAPAPSRLLNADQNRKPVAARGAEAAFSFSKAQSSLVRILVRLDKLSRAGTGFLISGKRLIATSNHVIENGKDFDLGFLDSKGRARWIHAELIAADAGKDLAILEAAEDIEGAALILGDYEPEWAGDVYAMGFPVAADEGVIDASSFSANGSAFLRPSVVKGIVSRVLDNPAITARMQHQAPISPGYSGGPLVDRCGAVVGVSNSHHKTDTGLSYAVLGSDLAALARRRRIPVSVTPACGSGVVETAYANPAAPQTPAAERDASAAPKIPAETDPYEAEMFRQATSCIERADIAAARLFLEHLVARGSARGALGLALTYDPNFLDRIQVVGLQPDVEHARQLYLKALERGSSEARWRLEALPPAPSSAADVGMRERP